jgi:hypothetical protein
VPNYYESDLKGETDTLRSGSATEGQESTFTTPEIEQCVQSLKLLLMFLCNPGVSPAGVVPGSAGITLEGPGFTPSVSLPPSSLFSLMVLPAMSFTTSQRVSIIAGGWRGGGEWSVP